MSRTPFAPLFARLVDDAAVFPPGLATIEVAVREHLDRREGPYAAELGPLLVPAIAAAEVAHAAARDDRAVAEPLPVGLIVRPGNSLDPLVDAVDLLRDEPRVLVTGAEVGWSEGWRPALELDIPVVVELGLGRDQEAGFEDVTPAVDDGAEVMVKFRTGPTPGWVWPDEHALAAFLDAVIASGLRFKLTGGLHHAVRGVYGGHQMHGVLNVLLATHEALDGADAAELADVLSITDSEVLVEQVSRLTPQEVARTRASFAAYGCCGVLEPLAELSALGLLPDPAS
ncbi:MAG: hypothetical protein L0H25_01680 [Micrococcales bacterium]|nr:hypothetical protein [Micrococcales bacterium]